jgi:hypothetical protein
MLVGLADFKLKIAAFHVFVKSLVTDNLGVHYLPLPTSINLPNNTATMMLTRSQVRRIIRGS